MCDDDDWWKDGRLSELVGKRYSSWDSELGKQIEEGKADFEYLEKKAKEFGEPKVPSAKQVQGFLLQVKNLFSFRLYTH